MGPWYLRNEYKPHLPGCSYEVLCKRIAAGRIRPDTVLRGPTTGQFWSYALTTPGVGHLLGQCHACGTPVGAQAEICPPCGAGFDIAVSRNTYQQYNQAVADLITRQRQINTDLCPSCGQSPVTGDQCHACGTVFAPPDKLQHHPVGSWALRDSNHPFDCGYPYELIVRLIDAGAITPKTIMRGPTAFQFWAIAENVAGVAHHLGICHHCHQSVRPTDTHCPHCHTGFAIEARSNELGLMFPTAAEVAAAQHRLDAAIGAQQQQWERQAYGSDADEPQLEEDPRLEDLARSVARAPAKNHQTIPTGPGTPAAELHIPVARPRGSTPRRQSALLPLALAIILPVALLGAILLVINRSSDGTNGQVATGNGTGIVVTPPPAANGQTATEAQIERMRALNRDFDQVKNTPTTPRFDTLLGAALKKKEQVSALWDAGKFDAAEAEFEALDDAIQAIRDFQADYNAAITARDRANQANAQAEKLGMPTYAPEQWGQALTSTRRANTLYAEEKYAAAKAAFDEAAGAFESAAAEIKDADAVQALRDAVLKEMTQNYPREQLEADGGAAWKELSSLLVSADAAIDAANHEDARKLLQQARQVIPRVEDAVKRVVGVNYYAFAAGYLGTHLLLEHAAGEPFDATRRQTLAQAYENLMLHPAFMEAIPAGADVPYERLAEVLVNDARKQIDAVHGPTVAASYNIGFQFRILERLLQGEGGLLTRADKTEIERSLQIVERDAKTAGYSSKIFKFCEQLRFNMTADDDYEAVKLARETLREMLARLSEYESALTVVTGSGQ